MTNILLQADQLTPVQRAVREQFQRGGSAVTALLLIVGIVVLVFFAYWLTTRLHRDEGRRPRINDPARLYRDLLNKLDLPPAQRRVLETVATDLPLQHPATILLSSTLFDRCMSQWNVAKGKAGSEAVKDLYKRLIPQIRANLFPMVS